MVLTDWETAASEYRDFYAPRYAIEVLGKELDPTTMGDVLNVSVSMDIEHITGFQLTVNNWDDAKPGFKYSDLGTFDVGNTVVIRMGYGCELRSMVTGRIVSMQPTFPESGSSTLSVSGLDGMFMLRDRKPVPNQTYVNRTDWQIAKQVGERNGLRVEVTEEGEVHPIVIQKNQDDASFLMERATRIDFNCYILTDPAGREKDTLFFIKPTDGRDREGDSRRRPRFYELAWGGNLINFMPTVTLSRQVSAVRVNGWNPNTKRAITYTARRRDLPGQPRVGTSGPGMAETILKGKQEVVVDNPVHSLEEARRLATSLLRERAYEFITATGRTVGLPDLRPGDNLQVSGVGTRFSGAYFVKKVDHMLGSSGYFTQFEARALYDERRRRRR